ncbi:ras-related protein Rab-33B [Cyanistes caeruleus]|uniref:RAB33B, member RAS onco family n=1 Tax=Cyanistes caeruleus TaxID=156563 RepID=A0A8C0VUC6_CYACU|nr:ras-related protein Rab-33B [Cyanistes caeruleus]
MPPAAPLARGLQASCHRHTPEVQFGGVVPPAAAAVCPKAVPLLGLGLVGKIQLWDTAGQERFRKSMVQHYYRNVHAVVFVYDMTNIASFHSLPSWIEECKQHLLANDTPRILVGNKCDLRSAIQVPTDLAQKFADTHSMPLFETSAKNPNDNDHVEAIFMTLAHKLKSHKPLMLSQPSDHDEIHIKPEPKPITSCWC